MTDEMYTHYDVETIAVKPPSLLERFANLLGLSTATVSPWLGKAWGIDVSRYQDSVIIPPGAIDFAVAKLGGSEYSEGAKQDVKFAQHIQSIYDAKAIPMAYWYVDSGYYTRNNHSLGDLPRFTNENHPILKVIVEGLRAGNGWKYVKALFFDCECDGAGVVWNEAYVEDLRGRIVDMQKAGTFPKIPLGIYSRQSWMVTQPNLSNWVAQHPEIIVWTANYLSSFPGTYKPLAQHRLETLPTVHTPRWFGDNPVKPKEYARCWQYHGSFPGALNATCPEVLTDLGKPSALDLNVWEMYDRAGLHDALGIVDRLTQEPPPDPDPDPEPTGDYVTRAEFDAAIKRLEGLADDHDDAMTTHEDWLDELDTWARNVGYKGG